MDPEEERLNKIEEIADQLLVLFNENIEPLKPVYGYVAERRAKLRRAKQLCDNAKRFSEVR